MDGLAILVLFIAGSVHPQQHMKKDVDEPMFIQAILDGYDSDKSLAENFYLLLGDICPRAIYCTNNGTYENDLSDGRENDTIFNVQLTRNNTRDRISEARKILRENSYKLQGCCVQCSCDKHCVERRNCCPTMGQEFQVSADTDTTNQPIQECVHAGIKSFPPHQITEKETGPAFYMVTDCFSKTINEKTANKCRYPHPEDIAEVIPVYSDETEKIYKNKFCAECNGEFNAIPWTPVFVFNLRFSLMDLASTPTKLYTPVLGNQKQLDLYFIPPSNSPMIPANFVCTLPTRHVISENICTEYSYSDIKSQQFFERTCKMKESRYNLYLGSFHNIFCFLCRGHGFYGTKRCEGSTKNIFTSYSALFSIDKLESEPRQEPSYYVNESPCNCTEYYDEIQKKCRKLICPPGEYFEICNCVKFISSFRNMLVKVYLNLTPVLQGRSARDAGLTGTSLDVNAFMNKLTRLVESHWGPIALKNSLLFGPKRSAMIVNESNQKYSAVLAFFLTGNLDNTDVMKKMFNKLKSGMSKKIQKTAFNISLGQIFKIQSYLGSLNRVEDRDEELLLMTPVASIHRVPVLSVFQTAQTLNKLVFCKRVELDEDEVDKLQHNISSLGMSQMYVDYVFWEKDKSMCLDDFEETFLPKSSSARLFLNTHTVCIYVAIWLVVYCQKEVHILR